MNKRENLQIFDRLARGLPELYFKVLEWALMLGAVRFVAQATNSAVAYFAFFAGLLLAVAWMSYQAGFVVGGLRRRLRRLPEATFVLAVISLGSLFGVLVISATFETLTALMGK